MKKQKVRFHKSDRRPDNRQLRLSYTKQVVKKGRKILWAVIEEPTKNKIAEYFFEEDADKLMVFQNRNRVWEPNGGIPSFLFIKA